MLFYKQYRICDISYVYLHVFQSSTLDSVTGEYLLELKFSSEREKRPFGRHSLSRLHGVLKRMRGMVDGDEWEEKRKRLRLFARLFGT